MSVPQGIPNELKIQSPNVAPESLPRPPAEHLHPQVLLFLPFPSPPSTLTPASFHPLCLCTCWASPWVPSAFLRLANSKGLFRDHLRVAPLGEALRPPLPVL